MPLELATALALRDPDHGAPLSLDRVKRLVCEWAAVLPAQLADGKEHAGVHNAKVRAQEHSGEGTTRWELFLSRSDESDNAVSWNVIISALETANHEPTVIAIRLRRESNDARLRPLTGSPAPPRIIRDILSDVSVHSFDGPIRIKRLPHHITRYDIGELLVRTQLSAADRRLPMVAVAASRSPRHKQVHAEQLARKLAGFAHVLLVSVDALPVLHAEIGPYSLNREAVRVWWPGIDLAGDDDPSLHKSWQGPFTEPQEIADEICSLIFETSRDRWSEPSALRDFNRELRRKREEQASALFKDVSKRLDALQSQAQESEVRTQAVEKTREAERAAYAELAQQIEELEDDAKQTQADLDEALRGWEEEEAKVSRLQSANFKLQVRLDGFQIALDKERGSDSQIDSDEDQFRAQVEAKWAATFDEAGGHEYPLLPFEIHERFLDSITSAGADHDKVIEVVMEVACGIAGKKYGRSPHRFRENSSGGSPGRVRKRDNAKAWRCNVQTNAPSARRLHYWQLNDGSIELSNVVVHDDETIFE